MPVMKYENVMKLILIRSSQSAIICAVCLFYRYVCECVILLTDE